MLCKIKVLHIDSSSLYVTCEQLYLNKTEKSEISLILPAPYTCIASPIVSIPFITIKVHNL